MFASCLLVIISWFLAGGCGGGDNYVYSLWTWSSHFYIIKAN